MAPSGIDSSDGDIPCDRLFTELRSCNLPISLARVHGLIELLERVVAYEPVALVSETACVHPSAVIEGPVFVGPGAIVRPHAFLQGPVHVGEGVEIGHGATLRHGAIVGSKCVVGHGSEVVRSLILPRSNAAHMCFVGDSVVGSNVNLGSHVVLANRKLSLSEAVDQSAPVTLGNGDVRIVTRRSSLGSFVGDDTRIAAAVVLHPGSVVARGSIIFPHAGIGGFIASRGDRLMPGHIEESTAR